MIRALQGAKIHKVWKKMRKWVGVLEKLGVFNSKKIFIPKRYPERYMY